MLNAVVTKYCVKSKYNLKKIVFQDIARDLLIKLSVEFVQDFLEQKLENSESCRHTSRAVCLCEYAEKHGLVQVPINDFCNPDRGLVNYYEESTNHFANVV